jgi:DNA repair protein RecO (recombination protein O)
MNRPKVYKTEAIVLQHMILGEADRIVTLYTPDLGKIRAVAKGIRRPSSKMVGHLEVLSHTSLLIARGRNLDIITQAHLINPFTKLRDDLSILSRGCYLAELVNDFTPDEEGNLVVYNLLINTMGWLQESSDSEILLRYFETHLLSELGYRPHVQTCVTCQRSLSPQDHNFSLRDGGVLCPSCSHGLKDLERISLTALKVLRYLLDNSYPQCLRLRVENTVSEELDRLMARYIRYHLDGEVRSAGFLKRLDSWKSKEHQRLRKSLEGVF